MLYLVNKLLEFLIKCLMDLSLIFMEFNFFYNKLLKNYIYKKALSFDGVHIDPSDLIFRKK